MWSLGPGDNLLRDEIQQFRRNANNKIEEMSYHIASLNKIEIDVKPENFLISIQKYSKLDGASPYYLYHLLGEYNLYFLAILFSMLNTNKTQEFQHRFCMLAEYLSNGCWTFPDQLSFLKLLNILLTHSHHLHASINKQKTHDTDNDITIQNEKFMIYHNFIQWIQNLALPKKYKMNNNNNNKYHNHSYPNLHRDRIFEFLNLLILQRADILYKLISFLEIARKINTQPMAEAMALDEETEAMRIYLPQIYYTHFMESIITIIIDSPATYVSFIGKILDFGYTELASNIVNKFQTMDEFKERVIEFPLINDIHNYIVLYLNKFNELISYLSINTKHKMAVITTTNNTKDNKVRRNLRMKDNEIILQAKQLLLNLLKFINYFDNDMVISYLSHVIPSKMEQKDGDDSDDVDRLDLHYHRSVCYTNLAFVCMIEEDYENVMQFAINALDNDVKNIQSHRYFLAGLISTFEAYNNHNSNGSDDRKHFHPQMKDIEKGLKLMCEVDNKHPFAVKVAQFLKLNKKILNCRRRVYGRYNICTKYAPQQRCLHTANAVSNHQLVIFGGMRYNENGMHIYNDLWMLDMYDNNWQVKVATNGAPNGRYDHSAYVLNHNLLVVIGGKINNNLHNDRANVVYNLLCDEYEYKLMDIYDIHKNIWYTHHNIVHKGDNIAPFDHLTQHISIKYNQKIYIFPIGRKLMYVVNIKCNANQCVIYWQMVTISVVIPSQTTLMINNGYIELLSIWKNGMNKKKIITVIHPNTYQYIKHINVDPFTHHQHSENNVEYFSYYTNKQAINKKKYNFMLLYGGCYVDKLQNMILPQLFDSAGKVYNELVLNISNKLMLIAYDETHPNELLYIGNNIELHDFLSLPYLYGHKITKVGKSLVVTGGVGNECGFVKSGTFSFVIQSIDKIIQKSITYYNDLVARKKAVNEKSKMYQTKQIKQQHNNNKAKQKQNNQSHSNQRFKHKKYKKNKQQKKGKNKSNKNKGKNKNNSQHNANNNENKQLIRQNNIRQDNVLKDVVKSLRFETIKISTNNNNDRRIIDIAMCSFCYVSEIYSTQNKWLKYVDNNNDEYCFCSMQCQQQFKHQQKLIQQQLKQYQQLQMQNDDINREAAE